MDLSNYIFAAPEMVLIGLICVVLVADLFVEDHNRHITFLLALASLAVTMATLLGTAPADPVFVFSKKSRPMTSEFNI